MRLGAFFDRAGKEVRLRYPDEQGVWRFDEDDYVLYALLCDPVYCAELLGTDPGNREYAGAFVVRDYQYPLFRLADVGCYVGAACARTIGKTESIKWRAVSHVIKRIGQNLLVTAPELIHLLPLTDAIEDRLRSVRLTRDFLDTRGGKTGFTHRPFGADFLDDTAIVGRIPRLTGTGVKGQHQPDLLIDEGQDYPEKGWTEVHEQIPLDSEILTPTGYWALRHLEVGDVIVGAGGAVTIEGMSAVTEREVLRVHLQDGGSAECDAEHLWTVTCNRYLNDGKWLLKRTEQIEADLAKPGAAFGSPQQPWLLPDIAPVEFRDVCDRHLDPYVLGVILGDGSTRGTNLTLTVPDMDYQIIDEVARRLPDRDSIRPRERGDRCPTYGIVGGRTKGILIALGVDDTLSVDKAIPRIYLYAPIAARLELLRGLVDTDGNVHPKGAVRFATSSPRLRDDVCWLVRSLGGRLSVYDQRNELGRDSWQVFFRLPEPLCPARLERKADAIRPSSNDKLRRRIVAVERTGTVKPMRCIKVSAADGIFVLGDFIPTHNTVLKDSVDQDGNPDFTYHFYGVHSGARDGGFFKRTNTGGFKVVNVTALQRPGWNKAEKDAAKAAYGGSSSPDYRRNILGEPGAAASAYFVTARLFACVDQDRASKYNELEYRHQEIRVEEFDETMLPIADVLDLPGGYSDVWGGADLGLTNAPTEILLFNREKVKGATRMKLIRRFTLERMRTRNIREAFYAIDRFYGPALKGMGIDCTGLGFPIWQEMEDDEDTPEHLLEVTRGYFFNAKVPVDVDKRNVTEDSGGRLRDQYGNAVAVEVDPLTGAERYVTYMPMIEASTRYLREWVDSTFLLLPFDPAITTDMQGETTQRVARVAGLKNKPNAFHILDAQRGAAMRYRSGEIEALLEAAAPAPVLDSAM